MRTSVTMHAEFGLLDIDGLTASFPSAVSTAGLIRINSPGDLRIATGVNMGPVVVEVEPCDAPPAWEDEAWEDIVELPVHRVPGARVSIHGPVENPLPGATDIVQDWHPCLRLRVSSTGRDASYDLAVLEPTEHYLVQVWPVTDPGEPVRTKASTRLARTAPPTTPLGYVADAQSAPVELLGPIPRTP